MKKALVVNAIVLTLSMAFLNACKGGPTSDAAMPNETAAMANEPAASGGDAAMAEETAAVDAAAMAEGSAPKEMAAASEDAAMPKENKEAMSEKIEKTEEEWRELLSPEAYYITREKGTERAFTGAYYKTKTPGVYHCVACGLELFDSEEKFESGTGWPSFWQPAEKGHVEEHADNTLGMTRTEVTCARCGAHLGHVFNDGPQPTGLRYCINSGALKLEERDNGEAKNGD